MKENLKTLGFFVLIALLCGVPYAHEGIKRGMKAVRAEGENARELYTGKTRQVYNPIDTAYVVTDHFQEMIKSEESLNFSQYKTWPVVSVWVDPKDLYDEDRGILKNSTKTGRLWERASFLSYYENGTKKFSSYAGVRAHGGVARRTEAQSFRFYFRKKNGEDSFLTDLDVGLKPGTPIKRLLLRKDTSYPFANDLGYSMVRQMGGIAPRIKHVAVYLNGKFYRYMQMVEQLHEEQAKYYFGHERFVFNKLKSNNSTRDRLLYENAIHRVKGESKPISFERMDKQFDLNNITANMLSIIYLGMVDWAQGVWIKDLTNEEAKWQIISWDYDYAFTQNVTISKMSKLPAWEKDGFKIALDLHTNSLRGWLFGRLIKESPEYKKYFVEKFDRMFEKELTDEFFKAKFAEYEKLAADATDNTKLVESIEHMKTFVKNRKTFLCQQTLKAVGELPKTCHVPF